MALHGSLVGWGTDIGGSIRIPSHMNGLWGFKPSVRSSGDSRFVTLADRSLQSGRMSYRGVEVSIEGQQHVPSAVGPITRSLNSMIAVTKLVIEAEHWKLDSQLPPMPWRNDVFETLSSRPLVIGIMPDDGVVKPLPPVARVFHETVAKLQAAGHEIVEWDISLNRRCIAVQVSEFHIAPQAKLTMAGRVLLRRRW